MASAIAPEPVPTSATRSGRSPMRSRAAATSFSLAARGVMTSPGSVLTGSPAK
jgi:hypothetical protein